MLMAVKNNQGKKVQLRGVVQRILVLKLKKVRRHSTHFKRLIIMVGTVMRLIKEVTVTRGVVRRIVVMKDKK
jgi:hypothetical protein